LRRQRGTCEQDLLHAETLPHTTKLGASYYKAHPLLLQSGHSSAGFGPSHFGMQPIPPRGERRSCEDQETAVADWLTNLTRPSWTAEEKTSSQADWPLINRERGSHE